MTFSGESNTIIRQNRRRFYEELSRTLGFGDGDHAGHLAAGGAQTLATFLTRLVEKGVLAVERRQSSNLYVPAVTEMGYRRLEARYVVESQYGGSLPKFLSAYYGGRGMSLAEQAELMEWFHQTTSMDLL